jgi:hypothetical protein
LQVIHFGFTVNLAGSVMISLRSWINVAVATLCSGLMAAHLAWSQEAASSAHSQTKDRARIVLSQPLSKLDGDHLKAVLMDYSVFSASGAAVLLVVRAFRQNGRQAFNNLVGGQSS